MELVTQKAQWPLRQTPRNRPPPGADPLRADTPPPGADTPPPREQTPLEQTPSRSTHPPKTLAHEGGRNARNFSV